MSDQNGNLIYTRPYNKEREREREKAKEREGANWLCDGSVSIFGLDFVFLVFVLFCFLFGFSGQTGELVKRSSRGCGMCYFFFSFPLLSVCVVGRTTFYERTYNALLTSL